MLGTVPPMEHGFELWTPLDGTEEEGYALLGALSTYAQWNHLIPVAHGTLSPGERLALRLRGFPGVFRPTVVSCDPPRGLVMEASIVHRSLVHMTHSFTFIRDGAGSLALHQRWIARGALVGLLWSGLTRTMKRFEEVGTDLDRAVVARRRGAP